MHMNVLAVFLDGAVSPALGGGRHVTPPWVCRSSSCSGAGVLTPGPSWQVNEGDLISYIVTARRAA